MLRGLTWLAKLVAAGLILSFLSIWTTGYIVTSYLESVLKQYELPIDVPPMAMSGVWGKLWGSEPHLTEQEENVAEGQGSEDDGNDNTAEKESDPIEAEEAFGEVEEPALTDVGVGKGSGAAGSADSPGSGSESDEVGGAAEGWTGTDESGGTVEGIGGTDGTETALSTDELTETKDKMSDEDKNKLFDLLLTKLPQEQLQQISLYMEEGLTEREVTNIEQIMAQYLDTQEYESMMDILKKY
ncbi:hypothetical protein ACX1C1_06985 [Paenibacillus sp. strain BS8-2]